MANHYCSPGGFEIDDRTGDEEITNENVDKKATDLTNYMRDYAKNYEHDFIMHQVGCDFTYKNATKNFASWDKLINYINAKPEFNMTVNYGSF